MTRQIVNFLKLTKRTKTIDRNKLYVDELNQRLLFDLEKCTVYQDIFDSNERLNRKDLREKY